MSEFLRIQKQIRDNAIDTRNFIDDLNVRIFLHFYRLHHAHPAPNCATRIIALPETYSSYTTPLPHL